METLPYQIQRTKNRTSRATLRDGGILIRLARGLSENEEQHHIANLLKRMTKAAVRQRTRISIDPFRPLLEGTSADHSVSLVTGTEILFRVTEGSVKRTRSCRSEDGWRIERGKSDNTRTFHRFLWKLLSMSAEKEIEALVRTINDETFRERIESVHTKFMQSRWGSCSLGHKITLSTPLLFTSPDILRYVIIHELAHIPHPDHSQRFWNAVKLHDPTFQTSRIPLRTMNMVRL